MATRYHVNPETNRPNICTAQNKCMFAVDGEEPPHFENKIDAKAFAEKSLTEEYGAVSTVAKPVAKNPWAEKRNEETNQQSGGGTEGQKYSEGSAVEESAYKTNYVILDHNFDAAVNSIEKANRKLARAGISERFEYETEAKEWVEWDNGKKIVKPYYSFTLSAPVISYTNDGKKHDFQAVIEKTESGDFVTRSARGVELEGWKPDNLMCDHCGQKRSRNKTYVVQDPDGNRLQIGSNCVQAYLGVRPAGLWALSYDPLENEASDMDGVRYSAIPLDNSEDVMAIALAISDEGDMFVSKSAAYENGMTSTYDRVIRYMQPATQITDDYELEERDRFAQRIAQLKEKGKPQAILERLKNFEGDSDYASNLRALSKSEHIKSRDIPTLISGIVALKTEERKAAEAKKRAEAKEAKMKEFTPGHYGQVNDKIEKGTVMTLHSKKDFVSSDYWGNDILKTIITAKDAEGHQITWFTGTEVEAEEGEELVISSGKVKKHGEFSGIDQTVLGNVRLMKKKK